MDHPGHVPPPERQGASVRDTAVLFLAQGFGTGRAPVAPGTVGTLPGVVLFVPLSTLPLPAYLGVVLALGAVGLWLCDEAARILGQDDPPSVVWDEIVGVLIALTAVPLSPLALLLGFALFRLFDITKPGPIGWADRTTHGHVGLGIMLDDVLAGVAAAGVLHALLWSFPGLF